MLEFDEQALEKYSVSKNPKPSQTPEPMKFYKKGQELNKISANDNAAKEWTGIFDKWLNEGATNTEYRDYVVLDIKQLARADNPEVGKDGKLVDGNIVSYILPSYADKVYDVQIEMCIWDATQV